MEKNDYDDNGSENDEEDFNEDNDAFNESLDDDNQNDGIEPTTVDEEVSGKKLLCIKYPGVVINPDKAIETLGGLASISNVAKSGNRRLELRFRPKDAYCKPACSDKQRTAGFLIRVRVKKSLVEKTGNTEKDKADSFKGPYDLEELDRLLGNIGRGINVQDSPKSSNIPSTETSTTEPNIHEREISKSSKTFDRPKDMDSSQDRGKTDQDSLRDENYHIPSIKIIGRIDMEYFFQNVCDFQYLPIAKTDGKTKCIYDLVFPTGIPPYSWLNAKAPYFLPPAAFSRMYSVQQYTLKTEIDKGPENIIGKMRKRRTGFSSYINFNTPEIPCKPPAGIEVAMRVKFLQKSHYERMRNYFEERPIWSKTALMCVSRFTNEQLKFLLPSVAYYFMTGPWRITWVKLGYDPRKDPQSRRYQTLDYRLKAMHGLEFSVKCKRSSTEQPLQYKSILATKPRTSILTSMKELEETQEKGHLLDDRCYIYREGVIPPSRQMFYQYCDIEVTEIQEMLAKLPNHLPASVTCDEKRGWLPSGFSDQCREIINRQVRLMLRKKMNIPEDHPTSLPPKRTIKTKPTEESSRKSAKKKKKVSKTDETEQNPSQ